MGSTFSMEQMMTTLSARSRITSSSYSFQPSSDFSISTCARCKGGSIACRMAGFKELGQSWTRAQQQLLNQHLRQLQRNIYVYSIDKKVDVGNSESLIRAYQLNTWLASWSLGSPVTRAKHCMGRQPAQTSASVDVAGILTNTVYAAEAQAPLLLQVWFCR